MSSEDKIDPKFPKKVLSIPPGRLASFSSVCSKGLSSLGNRFSILGNRFSIRSPLRRIHIGSDTPSSPNELQSPVAIKVDQNLTAGLADPILDQYVSSLRSNDPSSYFVSEIGAFVVRNGSSSGGTQVYSETKAAEATQEVNSWTETVTNRHILGILPSGVLDESTKLVFKNATYLQGQWREKFDASETQDYDFHLLGGSSVKVPFMVSKEKQLVRAYDGFKVASLPFKQVQDKGPISLNIFLPDAKDGLQALVDKVAFMKCRLPYEQVEVGGFSIPRFSFGSEASNALEGLGLVLPFSGEGGVSEMVPYGENLYVSSKLHKSSIEVNEEGMKAAAASVSVIKKREKIDFVADHPFLFLVREDRTGLVLFSGRVVNPLVGC